MMEFTDNYNYLDLLQLHSENYILGIIWNHIA